jgi:multidrug efflux system membrane fusion protein
MRLRSKSAAGRRNSAKPAPALSFFAMDDNDMTIIQRQAGESLPGSDTRPSEDEGAGRPGAPRPWFRLIVFFLLAALAWWGWKHYRATHPSPTPAEQSATAGGPARRGDGKAPVGVATVAPRDIKVVIDALGTVTPLATVTVVSQVSGVLQNVGFTEGQHVKKGDFLAQVDPRPFEALKAQYEGQLARDQGQLDQAKSDDRRYQTLLKQNSIAAQTAENQKYVVQQSQGTVRADQALIDAQNLNLTYAHIVSPLDGRIGLRLVDPGNYLQAGSSTTSSASGASAGIAVITEMKPISVIFSVPEDALAKILPRIRSGAKLIAEAYDRANVTKLASGEVSVLDNQVDTTTGMVKLRAVFDNDDEALFPNQFVNVRLLVATLKNAVAAPLAAVQHGAPGDYTYAIGPDGKASVRVLKLGQTDGDHVQILSGLEPGDVVVVDGADRLREGAEVRIVSGDGKPGGQKAENAPDAAPVQNGESR